MNLPDAERISACGPRTAKEALSDFYWEEMFIRHALEHLSLCGPARGLTGEDGPYPPRVARCSEGPRHHCTPTETPTAPWEFESLSATRHPALWSLFALEATEFLSGRVSMMEPTVWHRTLRWEQTSGGCAVDFIGEADVDGDGRFATKALYLIVDEGGVRRRAGPTGSIPSDFVAEGPPKPITAPAGFVPLPEAGCEELEERARHLVCGPHKLQHIRERVLDFRDDNLGLFVKKGLCFDEAFGSSGGTVFFPPDTLPCHRGPDRMCVATEHPGEPWEFRPLDPNAQPYWAKLAEYGFEPETSAYASKQIRWRRTGTESCEVELEIKGDLDGDGIPGRYTVRVQVTPDGDVDPTPDGGTMHPE